VKRWIAILPLGVLALLGVLFAGYGLRHDPRVVPDALVGKPLPDLALPRLDGGPTARVRAELSGPTFVNVFASWCVPCAVESPALMAMKAQGARIVGVAYKDDPTASKAFLDRYGDPFTTVLVDRDGRAGIELGVSGVPETFAVDARGVIVAKHAGPMTRADALALVDAIRAGG
jgi:cytochrome c biogenesis protein CcmG/thiol:disulfide interchange protein DsbE